jgi:hypothetical protein
MKIARQTVGASSKPGGRGYQSRSSALEILVNYEISTTLKREEAREEGTKMRARES